MNMKLKNILCGLVLAATLAAPLAAEAQYDMFESPRTFILCNTNIGTATGVTNGWLDHRALVGQAKIDFAFTSTSGSAANFASVRIDVSPDQTNITTLTNYALITTNNQLIYTNFYWGSNAVSPINTNYIMRPGTPVTPNGATAGFTTPYLTQAGTLQYTNGGAISMLATNNTEQIGFLHIEDLPLYIRFTAIFTNGAGTNVGVTALLTSAVRLY